MRNSAEDVRQDGVRTKGVSGPRGGSVYEGDFLACETAAWARTTFLPHPRARPQTALFELLAQQASGRTRKGFCKAQGVSPAQVAAMVGCPF